MYWKKNCPQNLKIQTWTWLEFDEFEELIILSEKREEIMNQLWQALQKLNTYKTFSLELDHIAEIFFSWLIDWKYGMNKCG